MAADEALLQSAARGTASLRFYGWSEATVTLGYFQPHRVRLAVPKVAGLPFVRRPSGGATLVHDRELTYCLALPPGAPWQVGGSWLIGMHQIIAAALAELGIHCQLHERKPERHGNSFLCFQQVTPGDVLIGAAKVLGSAQRKQRGALLQHGAILLESSPHAPSLPGIKELTGTALPAPGTVTAILRAFAQRTQAEIIEESWTDAERAAADTLVTRYRGEAWNCKR
jgi:lipoate-protein ligase A